MSAVWAIPRKLEDCAAGFRASGLAATPVHAPLAIHNAPELTAALARLNRAEQATSTEFAATMISIETALLTLAADVMQADR